MLMMFGVLTDKFIKAPQAAQFVGPMLTQCWASVADGGATLRQHMASGLCFLDHTIRMKVISINYLAHPDLPM